METKNTFELELKAIFLEWENKLLKLEIERLRGAKK